MKRRCALALPETREAKSASERLRVTAASLASAFDSKMMGRRLTISLAALRSSALADSAVLLQIQVPALLLAVGILDRERDNGLGLVDGLLARGLVALEGLVDHVERGGGGESVWAVSIACGGTTGGSVPFLRDMMAEDEV